MRQLPVGAQFTPGHLSESVQHQAASSVFTIVSFSQALNQIVTSVPFPYDQTAGSQRHGNGCTSNPQSRTELHLRRRHLGWPQLHEGISDRTRRDELVPPQPVLRPDAWAFASAETAPLCRTCDQRAFDRPHACRWLGSAGQTHAHAVTSSAVRLKYGSHP